MSKKAELGRTRIEALSRFLLVCVIFACCIYAFVLAIRNHRANNILDDIRMATGTVMFQEAKKPGEEIPLQAEFKREQKSRNQLRMFQNENNLVTVIAYDVDYKICRMLLNKAHGAYNLSVSQGEEWIPWTEGCDICGDGSELKNIQFQAKEASQTAEIKSEKTEEQVCDPNTDPNCCNKDNDPDCCNKTNGWNWIADSCVHKTCPECFSSNENGECRVDDRNITAESLNKCLQCNSITGELEAKTKPDGLLHLPDVCFACIGRDLMLNCTKPNIPQECCEACKNSYWVCSEAEKCTCIHCPEGTEFAPSLNVCCPVNPITDSRCCASLMGDEYEWYKDACVKKCLPNQIRNLSGNCVD